MSKIKLGLTLYCFTGEYARGEYTLEDCVRKAKEFGAEGLEIVATQMIPSYPYVSDAFLGEFRSILDTYGMELSCYAANMDRGMRRDRNLTEDEMLERAIQDVKSANKLGCKVMREQFLLSPRALRRLAPYAEQYDVKVGIEIHNPEYPTSPIMREYLEEIVASGSSHIGFIPDFGCFATKPNKPNWDEALKNGAQPELLELAAKLRYDEVPMEEARKRLLEAGANGAVMGAFSGMYGFVTFYNQPDIAGLREIMPYCFEMHGKFHYVHPDLHEESIPYEQILPVVKNSGFEGYIMSEYEDHSSDYAGPYMIKRHLDMEKRILASC